LKNKLAALYLIAALMSLTDFGCSYMQLSRYDNFGEWYLGKPGLANTITVKKINDTTKWLLEPAPLIAGRRPFIYGHFRLPEILFQPSGGLFFPARTNASQISSSTTTTYTTVYNSAGYADHTNVSSITAYTGVYDRSCERAGSSDWFGFCIHDAGMMELLPYRYYFSNADAGKKVGMTFLWPVIYAINVSEDIFWRAPVYAVHDVGKTLFIPIALVYYLQ
jgi:hypothetical protein